MKCRAGPIQRDVRIFTAWNCGGNITGIERNVDAVFVRSHDGGLIRNQNTWFRFETRVWDGLLQLKGKWKSELDAGFHLVLFDGQYEKYGVSDGRCGHQPYARGSVRQPRLRRGLSSAQFLLGIKGNSGPIAWFNLSKSVTSIIYLFSRALVLSSQKCSTFNNITEKASKYNCVILLEFMANNIANNDFHCALAC